MFAMKMSDLLRYRQELAEEHQAKIAAIDVLLGRTAPKTAVQAMIISQSKRH
jgi:hypothetical protein